MRVLVTGATGFLGSVLTVRLQREGVSVVATGRNEALLDRLGGYGAQTVALDLAQPLAETVARSIGPLDAVVHCAGLSSPWGTAQAFESANVAATVHVADLAARLGVRRFVMISTASVYFRFADQDSLPETAPLPAPVNEYARSKRGAEIQVLARSEIGPVIIRPRGIYGAGDTALLPRLLRVAQHRALPQFAKAGATDITHVDDVVSAICAALDAGPQVDGETINVSGGVGIALPEIIMQACHHVGVAARWRRLPFGPVLGAVRAVEAAARILPGRPEPPVTAYSLGILRYRQTLDIGKAQSLLGWSPQISFEEGLARTFANGAMRPGVL